MIFALMLLGCTAWIDQEPACGQDIYYWSDDLLAFVLTGNGSGQFAFDPEDQPRTQVAGSYDSASGNFAWTSTHDEEYYLQGAEAEGIGTVFHNGNLDLKFTEVVTDMLGKRESTDYRVQRTGCEMTIASWESLGTIDDALVMTGKYSGDDKWSWTAEDPDYSYQGTLQQDLVRTIQVNADDGSYWSVTTTGPDGVIEQDWAGDCSDYECEGKSTRHFDGRLSSAYTASDGSRVYAESTGEFAYDGSGSQTIEYVGDTTCTYTYNANGGCNFECQDGTEGRC